MENKDENLLNEMDLLIDLHINQMRQGPGSKDTTLKALNITRLSKSAKLNVADIGCGTGFQTLVLAENTKWDITGVDFLESFIDKLNEKIKQQNIGHRVFTKTESMDNLSFPKESLDLIWSEGAIYNIGFESGLKYWKSFLKKDGVIAISEISWLKDEIPMELKDYWTNNYNEIDSVENKIRKLEECGYTLVDYFILPVNDWLDNYYSPLEKSFDEFLSKHANNPLAFELIANEKEEIDFFKRYKEYFSYGFYIGKKI